MLTPHQELLRASGLYASLTPRQKTGTRCLL